jgi:hypothetical protein
MSDAPPYLPRNFGDEERNRALLAFHQVLRPRLAASFRRKCSTGIDTHEVLSRTESHLLERLLRDQQERTAAPDLCRRVQQVLGLRQPPRFEKGGRERAEVALRDLAARVTSTETFAGQILSYLNALLLGCSASVRTRMVKHAKSLAEELAATFLPSEVIREAMLEAHGKKRGPAPTQLAFATEGSFFSYCWRIYTNVVNDLLREKGRRREVSLDSLSEDN